jgi:hypothetical protein
VEVNLEDTEYIFMCQQNAGQIYNRKIADKSFGKGQCVNTWERHKVIFHAKRKLRVN